VTAGEQGGSSAGQSLLRASTLASPANSGGKRIVSEYPVDHRDVSDASFEGLKHVPADRGPQSLGRMGQPAAPRGFAAATAPVHSRRPSFCWRVEARD